ncbi:putative ABC transport system permease protein [Hydrogenispora ethanolica]|uniref:Putative ABC transport system permease protein n=1 Tax=Hydrogenispora ethanolica TaxID=1082276 RepID=A0A4R1RQA6_HYDET|nr:ABC transporter permease [Hydrogenispora ethanolica]TCL68581.1 putative ABC transport system permease protein [Hydrogenispora ethanolica]
MRITENVTMAVKNLTANKIRSLLTMLGVIIGVAAVIDMVALGEGAKQQVTKNITAMGSNLVMVFPGMGTRRGGSFGGGQPLTNAILPVIEKAAPEIAAIAPEARSSMTIGTGVESMTSSVIGCTIPYFSLRNYQLAEGRLFSESEVNGRRRVAVIGSYVASELFGGYEPLGQDIKVGVSRFQIIGVLKEKGQSGFNNSDDLVLIPLSTAQQRVFGNQNVDTIYIQADSADHVDSVYNQVYAVLLQKFKDESKFNVRNQAEILSTVQQTTQTFTLLLAGIAAVSLLVGGIGIMNIMLVSVTERIKEIGIRKALGAQKSEILGLFLIEAVGLSLAGGLIGISLGWILASAISRFSGWTTVVSPASIVVSFGFSILVGLFFGGYPAYKAAGMNPIEALRHE